MKEVYQVNVYISQSEYTEPRYYESASDAHNTEAVFLSKEDAKKFCAELSKALTSKDAYAQVEAVYLYNDLTDRLTDRKTVSDVAKSIADAYLDIKGM